MTSSESKIVDHSSSKILLIGDCIISNLARYPEIWKKYFFSHNTLNFGIPGDKIQHALWRIENLNFPLILVLSIFSFFVEQTILNITPQKNLSTE